MNIKIIESNQAEVVPQEWGSLTWRASSKLSGSESLTLGECRIKPGCKNPRHFHPNCDEILRVDQGKILHTYGDKEKEMNVGDCITIPNGVEHNAINIGTAECLLTIAFTAGNRQTTEV